MLVGVAERGIVVRGQCGGLVGRRAFTAHAGIGFLVVELVLLTLTHTV